MAPRFTKLVIGIIHEAEGAGEIQKVKFPEIKCTVQNLVYDKGVTSYRFSISISNSV